MAENANSYYSYTSGQPVQLSRGSSAAVRAEFAAIEAAFYAMEQTIAAASSAADFKLIYQGARATDPTQRYNGTQLQNGDLYFNTGVKVMKSFADGAWYSLVTSSAAMLKDGGAFTGPITGTSATFANTVKAGGFEGNGSLITGLTSAQIIAALGFTPLGAAGGTVTGAINGTNATFSGSVTASDFIMTSDERRKQKWEQAPDSIVDDLAAMKKIGTYYDKKEKRRRTGAGAQSFEKIFPTAVGKDAKGELGISYGPAALVVSQKLAKRIVAIEKRLSKLEK